MAKGSVPIYRSQCAQAKPSARVRVRGRTHWNVLQHCERYGRSLKHRLMPLRQNNTQVSPIRLKITLLIAGFGPLIAIGLWLQSKGFFS